MAVAGGINGFGRIGRPWPASWPSRRDRPQARQPGVYQYMAYQFKYDSIHGRYPGTIEPTADGLMIDGVLTSTTHTRDRGNLLAPWAP